MGLSAAATGPSGTFEDTGTTATKITEAPSNYQLYRYTLAAITLSASADHFEEHNVPHPF